MSRKKRTSSSNDNGFDEWGGYMGAKKAKLANQFNADAASNIVHGSSDERKIFSGIAIFVNGYTVPSADELKLLMIKYGGIYNHYYDSKKTTHVIASNLPNCKIQKVKDTKIIKPEWIVDSIKANRLLDYRPYLLYTNQSITQPKLFFKNVDANKPSCSLDELTNERVVLSLDYRKDNLIETEKKSSESLENKSSTMLVFKPEIIHCNDSIKNSCIVKHFEKEEIPNQQKIDDQNSELNKQITNQTVEEMKQVCNENRENSLAKNLSSRITASDKNFLSEFYSNSRLHHISTMGATFKQYVSQLRNKNLQNNFNGRIEIKKWLDERKCSNDVQSDCDNANYDYNNDAEVFDEVLNEASCITENSKSKNTFDEKIIMHIDMDCFFVSVGIRNRPELKGEPVAVTHAKVKSNSDHHLRKESNFKTEIELYRNRVDSKLKINSFNKKPIGQSSIATDEGAADNSNIVPVTRYDWASTIGELDSMSEVASCSYEARKAGVKNGMFLGQALKLCPELKTIQYDFDDYRSVSYMLYDTVAEYTLDIEAVSCDEMFVDCTNLLKDICCTSMEFASFLRKQIKERTGCPCSTGFGGNRLQARLATRKAKPDGQFFLQTKDVVQFMKNIDVSDLPGVGKTISYKLATMNIKTCEDLQNYSLPELKNEWGEKTGKALYNHCRGIDDKELNFGHVRKSVSAEVNYGIRFQNQDEAEKFLHQLSSEVQNRLQEIEMKTKCITLKLMVRAKGAPEETAKFLGHGFCNNLSKSSTLTLPVSDVSVIFREVLAIYRKLRVMPKDLRGIGIQLSRLVPVNSEKINNAVLDRFLKPKGLFADTKNKYRSNSIAVRNDDERYTWESAADSVNANKEGNIIFNRNDLKSTNKCDISESLLKVDKDVLAELPKNLQDEIIKNCELLNYNILSIEKSDRTNGKDISNINIQNENVKSEDKCVLNASPSKDTCNIVQRDNLTTRDKELTIPKVDESYLRGLPLHLQEEVLRNFSHNIQDKALGMYNHIHPAKFTDKLISLKSVGEFENLNDEFPISNEIYKSVEEVRDLVWKWVTEESLPLSQDVKMIFSLLVKYVYAHCLDDLNIVINTLFWSIKKKENDKVWKEVYSSIIKKIQEAMIIEYGGELKLEYDFNSDT